MFGGITSNLLWRGWTPLKVDFIYFLRGLVKGYFHVTRQRLLKCDKFRISIGVSSLSGDLYKQEPQMKRKEGDRPTCWFGPSSPWCSSLKSESFVATQAELRSSSYADVVGSGLSTCPFSTRLTFVSPLCILLKKGKR